MPCRAVRRRAWKALEAGCRTIHKDGEEYGIPSGRLISLKRNPMRGDE
jgi:hypothetical protein